MQENLGCFELFTGKAECDRHHFGVVARLEEGTWRCCDRPALRYRWVYSVHGLKTLHIGYPTDTRTGSWEMQQVKIAENCRSPSLLPVLLSPASYLMPPLRENINTTLMHLQRHNVRLPRRVQQGTPRDKSPLSSTQARPLSPASPTSLLLPTALPRPPFFLESL